MSPGPFPAFWKTRGHAGDTYSHQLAFSKFLYLAIHSFQEVREDPVVPVHMRSMPHLKGFLQRVS